MYVYIYEYLCMCVSAFTLNCVRAYTHTRETETWRVSACICLRCIIPVWYKGCDWSVTLNQMETIHIALLFYSIYTVEINYQNIYITNVYTYWFIRNCKSNIYWHKCCRINWVKNKSLLELLIYTRQTACTHEIYTHVRTFIHVHHFHCRIYHRH